MQSVDGVSVFDVRMCASAVTVCNDHEVSMTSTCDSFNRDDVDADDAEIAATRASANALADLFPQYRSRETDENVRVGNVCITDVIVARALSAFDDDLNPDPLLVVPDRVAQRVVQRSLAASLPTVRGRKRQSEADNDQDRDFIPRRSRRIAGHAAPVAIDAPARAQASNKRYKVERSAPATLQPPQRQYQLTVLANDAAHVEQEPPSQGAVQEHKIAPKRPSRRTLRNAAAKRKRDAAARAADPVPSDGMPLPELSGTPPLPVSDFSFSFRPVDFTRAGLKYERPAQPVNPTLSASLEWTSPPSKDPALPLEVIGQSMPKQARRHHGAHFYQKRSRVYYATLSTEAYHPVGAVEGKIAVEQVNRSAPGWQGAIKRKQIRDVLCLWGTPRLTALLEGMFLIPYRERNTVICDMNGRCIVFRSTVVPPRDGIDQVDLFACEAFQLSQDCPVKAGDRLANPRGDHWYGIAGTHRQYTKAAHQTSFQKLYDQEISRFFRPKGPAALLTEYLTVIMRTRFPAIVARMERNHKWHFDNTKHLAEPTVPKFGMFWNFCLNVPSPNSGVERVFCRPHADQKNCAVLVCAVLPFWPKGLVTEEEWSWLVIWELGIIMQCPRGSFIIYPSALLFHFNVRIVKCKKGETPTPENSEEIKLDGIGRGSAVWYSQASMFSVTDERDSKTGRLPDYEELARRCFPQVVTPEDLLNVEI